MLKQSHPFTIMNTIFHKAFSKEYKKFVVKPKKIRKRFTQTRSWFRTLKWVACKSLL